jgi:hypothetical protein
MNTNEIYNRIYQSKFGACKNLVLNTGIVTSEEVSLYLDDLGLLKFMSCIVDYYRKIEKEGNIYMINVPGNKYYTFCKHPKKIYNIYCIDCKIYTCTECIKFHEKHVVECCHFEKNVYHYCDICGNSCDVQILRNDKKVCTMCDHKFTKKLPIYHFSKPMTFHFNMYEWIPINEFILENRNINSEMYKRNIKMEYKNGCLFLSLLTSEYEGSYEDMFLNDSYNRVFDHYNIPEDLELKIKDLMYQD